ncbi:phosphotransferase family protein [Streptomyces sp. BE230]|uniref:phosphotransferase family protein n=1 Tax=Streptomyces sp. BE230 TaxID=3002526 RepID=UPI002ED6B552|nr:phosphotransferase family protein [Streptomyces sp. BE230]
MSDTETNGTEAALRSVLAELWGRPASVSGLHRLSGGASRHTWAFEATPAGGSTKPYVLRCDAPGRPRPDVMELEAAAIRAAAAVGVPVPGVDTHGDGRGDAGSFGRPYMVMERLEGETIPRKLLRDERFASVRPGLARELGRIAARIHRVSPSEVPNLPDSDPLDELRRTYAEFTEAHPAIELGLAWLVAHRTAPVTPALVHGDFRNGNLLVDDGGVRGILDWELAHAGDPLEDLGWLCTKAWRFGSPHPAGGFGSREELLRGYAEVAGERPDPERLHWWEVYGTVRWAVLCRKQAEKFLSGAEDSVELAVLGRKVCEQEWDILLALGLAEPVELADCLDGAAAAAPAPHDAPGTDALLAAVTGLLGDRAVTTAGDARFRYLARVASGALAVARRELRLPTGQEEAHRIRLGTLGFADDSELAEAIRSGRVEENFPQVVAFVRESVLAKLAVANPRHAGLPG